MDRTRLPLPAPARTKAPDGAPNVLVILLDDMGFGASSTFGGPCPMPTADRLADEGVRFNRFHTTALCSPTRAALLTGRNHHSVGMGVVTDFSTTAPGYTGVRPASAGTLAQVLKGNGYATGAFGKWHQTPGEEITPVGPFDRWPTEEGFEKFYGIHGGADDQFSPTLYDGVTQIDPPRGPEDYHLSEDLIDQAEQWIRDVRSFDSDKPWFAYVPFGATHAPFQVPADWVGRYRGQFAHGWDRQREITLARQKELGVLPADTELSEWPEDVPRWDDLTENQRKVAERLMEVYAAFAEHTDAQVGRLLEFLRSSGELENTLVLYILGDNGASPEGRLEGSFNEARTYNGIEETADEIVNRLDEIGGPTSNSNYPVGWALAMDTPFRWTKQVASHFGGTRNGMVVRYPAGITAPGGIRSQWHHVIDVLPTVLEAVGVPHPVSVDGVDQTPIEGTSFLYCLDAPEAPDRHTTQYFEIFGHRGIYHEGWTAVTKHRTPWALANQEAQRAFEDDVWELYDIDRDWSQARDLAAEQPDRLAKLQRLFLEEAERFQVLPLDDRGLERMNAETAGRWTNDADRSIVLTPGHRRLRKDAHPNLRNTSYEVSVDVEVTSTESDGVLVCEGNGFNGWSFYVKDGTPVFAHNLCGLEWTHIGGREPIPVGRHLVTYLFAYDGGGPGMGGTGTLLVDGEPVGEGRIERTPRFTFGGTLNVGLNPATAITDDYSRGEGNPFTDRIHTVRIAVGADRVEPSARERLAAELVWH